MWLTLLLIAILAVCWLTLRPRLNPARPAVSVPESDDLTVLARWLDETEAATDGVVAGTEAHIRFANPDAPARTPLCFVYLHGFSATWPETAPVTERLAAEFGANVLQGRLAGHGEGSGGMLTPAERWLESVQTSWELATRLGERVVIVATSTGAPLAVWLARQPGVSERLHALLFMSPNFGIRSPFGFLLTAPFSKLWIRLLLGKERVWEPINAAQAKFWTHQYSSQALTEMQKVVDWVQKQDLSRLSVPLATMLMKNDPTISPKAASEAFERWGASSKSLIFVDIDPEEVSHVFVGDITAPHRNDWVVSRFAEFLKNL